MLIASVGGEKIFAENANRQDAYSCPECQSPVILKHGAIKIAHFAHKSKKTDCENNGETREHMMIKYGLFKRLEQQGGWKLSLEQKIKNRRTDLYAAFNGQRYCFEIQLSPISGSEMKQRMLAYASINAITIWVFYHKEAASYGYDDGVFKSKEWWKSMQKFQDGVSCFANLDGQLFLVRMGPAYSEYRYLKTFKHFSSTKFDIGLLEKKKQENLLTYRLKYQNRWWE